MKLLLLLLSSTGVASFQFATRLLPPSRASTRGSTVVLDESPQLEAPMLTGVQKRVLRTHAGRLAASKSLKYVTVADAAASTVEVDRQLTAHELVRCKFRVEKKKEAKLLADDLAGRTGATVAEVLGHTALLYRPSSAKLISLDK